jgi:TPR repeat protein
MLTMSHYLEYCAPEYLYYQIDTSSGQSGSPIVVVRETPEGTNPYIVGVHAYGDERLRRNFGIRLSQSRFDWLVDLINRTNGAFVAQTSGLPKVGTSIETNLGSHFYLGNIEITPDNFEEIQRMAQSNQGIFETYKKGVYVKGWSSSKGGVALAVLLKQFKQCKRLKIEINWEREKEEEEIIRAIGDAVGASAHLEELDLSNCRLTNQRLLRMLDGLQDSQKLKRLSIRENYFRAGIIELVRGRLTNLQEQELDIETDEYPPLSEVTPWYAPSDLYNLYYRAFLGVREKYEELMTMHPDPLVLSYRMLLAYLTNGYSRNSEATISNVISLARDIPMVQLREMAEKGNPEAQNNLGFALIIASGNQDDPELMRKAYRWFRKAASMNFIEAELGLSFCAEVRTNIEDAITHCKKAAENSHAGALLRLATTLYPRYVRMVVDIEHGAPMTDQGVQILAAATSAMKAAAVQGHVEAQFMFAESLEHIAPRQEDIVKRERLEWYKRASNNGHEGARAKFEQLSNQ